MGELADWLQDLKVGQFAEGTEAQAQLYANQWAPRILLGRSGVGDMTPEFLADFVELGATEFALAIYFVHGLSTDATTFAPLEGVPALSFPIPVFPGHVAMAIFKTDCGPFIEHGRKRPEEIQPWDVFLFSGDMSKAEVSQTTDLLPRYEAITSLVETLSIRFTEVGLHDAVEESGLLAAQGLVWAARLALLRGEGADAVRNATPFEGSVLKSSPGPVRPGLRRWAEGSPDVAQRTAGSHGLTASRGGLADRFRAPPDPVGQTADAHSSFPAGR